jgi:hypothetical protein
MTSDQILMTNVPAFDLWSLVLVLDNSSSPCLCASVVKKTHSEGLEPPTLGSEDQCSIH